jgi:ATP-dependent protease HslVU (ClpYQ) peptidase subunit
LTCIVGIVEKGKVWVGGDSLGSRGGTKVYITGGKVTTRGEFVIGTCGPCRTVNLARHVFEPPPLVTDADVDAYMAKDFAEAWRACVKENGLIQTEEGAESQMGMLLVGVRGFLYEIDGYFSAVRPANGYTAIGSGDSIALGALYATKGMPPEKRLKLALEAAEKWDDGVAGPFHIESTK